MKFLIITHVEHLKEADQYFGYAPYVREMNIWFKYTDEVIIVGPLLKKKTNRNRSCLSASKNRF